MTKDFRLPSFLVVGGVKAATTWTQAQLSSNPAVFIPAPEPHFFSSAFDEGLGHYMNWFGNAAPEQIIGEKSADYLAHPLAAERISQLMPHVKLVVQLRNPVERAYSDYKMLYRRGTISGPPEEHLTGPGSAESRFLADGLYACHLSRWFEYFHPSQIKILLYEEIRHRPRESMEKICNHIDAPVFFDKGLAEKRVNNSAEKHLPLALRRTLAPLKPRVAPFRNSSLFRSVRGLFAKKIDYKPMSDSLRSQLADFYAEDVADLSIMLERPLYHWLADPKKGPDAELAAI